MIFYPNQGVGQVDPQGFQRAGQELGNFPDEQSPEVLERNAYGTFKASAKDNRDKPEFWLNHAVKLLSAIAVCGILLTHLSQPQFMPLHGKTGRLVSPVLSAPSPVVPPHGDRVSISGHCVDLEPAICHAWFQPSAGHDSKAMCAADLMRVNPICPRSCGSCSILLAGCKKIKAVDIGNDCKVGEDVVGEVCENDDKPGESYCTYLPPAIDGTKATFACSVCQDPLSEMSRERSVILAQMKELRNEEIAREDEKMVAQAKRARRRAESDMAIWKKEFKDKLGEDLLSAN